MNDRFRYPERRRTVHTTPSGKHRFFSYLPEKSGDRTVIRTYMTFSGNWEQAMTTTIEAIKINASIISETRFFILHPPFYCLCIQYIIL